MSEALKRLESEGHTVVHFALPNIKKIFDQLYEHILADDGKGALEDWKDEILDQSIIVNRMTLQCPIWLRKFLFLFVEMFSPSTARGGFGGCYPRCCVSTSKFWDSMSKLDKRMAAITHKMNQENVDIVLAPGMAYPGKHILLIVLNNVAELYFIQKVFVYIKSMSI